MKGCEKCKIQGILNANNVYYLAFRIIQFQILFISLSYISQNYNLNLEPSCFMTPNWKCFRILSVLFDAVNSTEYFKQVQTVR